MRNPILITVTIGNSPTPPPKCPSSAGEIACKFLSNIMRVVFWRLSKNISNGTFVRDFECTYHYPKATIFRKCEIRVGLELFRVTECGVVFVFTFTCIGCFDCDWLHLCLASVAVLIWSGLVCFRRHVYDLRVETVKGKTKISCCLIRVFWGKT
jgi:hypothetical protein